MISRSVSLRKISLKVIITLQLDTAANTPKDREHCLMYFSDLSLKVRQLVAPNWLFVLRPF